MDAVITLHSAALFNHMKTMTFQWPLVQRSCQLINTDPRFDMV